ncbi:MAG: 6,7-dimethyl-8-ribityllumazine synthase [Elusimicrobia bacterium]|nr:6,7-dimethyl-8-ribityllumazine synthase [Elusimicrobiota bacterium]
MAGRQVTPKIGIVASRFNEMVTHRLLKGALATLRRHGINGKQVEVVWVPGAFEIPLAAQHMIRHRKPAVVICLGAVIRGETPHFEYISQAVSQGMMRVALDTGVPVIFGVLTTNTVRQAMARAGGKMGNRGADAALTALTMIQLLTRVSGNK